MRGIFTKISSLFNAKVEKEETYLEMLHNQGLLSSLFNRWSILETNPPGFLACPVSGIHGEYEDYIDFLKSEGKVIGIYEDNLGDATVCAIILEDGVFGYFSDEIPSGISIHLVPDPIHLSGDPIKIPLEQMIVVNEFAELFRKIENGEVDGLTINNSLLEDIYNIIVCEVKKFRSKLDLSVS